MPGIRRAIIIAAPCERVPQLVSSPKGLAAWCNTVWGHLLFKLKGAAERGGLPCPLFTKSGMETPTSTSGAY